MMGEGFLFNSHIFCGIGLAAGVFVYAYGLACARRVRYFLAKGSLY